ncbi:MAG: O-acetyl-ADP-ribose deacetylase [Frankiales bacterium]|nr:O-acetyl-ADP-ribose deacetylase [Frankiales bacterium]
MTVLRAVLGDLTATEVDAVVNAANSSLLGGGGVDGALHRAGGPEILAECRQVRRERYPDGVPPGEAVATTAGRLPARWVVHTVGPVYGMSGGADAELLASCHRRSLEVCLDLPARTVAFPAISCGAYGYPWEEAARVAAGAVRATVAEHPGAFDEVRFVLVQHELHRLFAAALADG